MQEITSIASFLTCFDVSCPLDVIVFFLLQWSQDLIQVNNRTIQSMHWVYAQRNLTKKGERIEFNWQQDDSQSIDQWVHAAQHNALVGPDAIYRSKQAQHACMHSFQREYAKAINRN